MPLLVGERFVVTACYALLLALLVLSMRQLIVPIYGYSGFFWSPDPVKLAEAMACVLLVARVLPPVIAKPSDLFVHVQFLFPVLPLLAIYGSSDGDRAFTWSVVLAFLLACLLASRLRPRTVRFGRFPPRHLMVMLLLASVAIIAAIVAFGGLSYWNTDLFRVYEFRGESWSNLPAVFGYLAPLASKVLLPSTLLFALLFGLRSVALLAVALSFVLFGLTSHKDILVYPLAVLAIYTLLGLRRPLRKLIGGYLGLVLLGMLSLSLFGGRDLIGNLGLRRAILLPGQIAHWYHDFFSHNTLMLWSQSKVSFGLIEPRYVLPGSKMIGLANFDSETSNVTTGWIGSGFMNGGTAGLFVYATIIGVLLAYLDGVARHVDRRAVVAIATPPLLTVFLSSDLPTAMLNHGVLLMLLMFAFFEIGERRGSRVPPAAARRMRRRAA